MTYELDAAGIGRLEGYFEGIGALLGEKRRRASFALYAMGILGEHERKSVEPLAAAATDDPEGAQRAHDPSASSRRVTRCTRWSPASESARG